MASNPSEVMRDCTHCGKALETMGLNRLVLPKWTRSEVTCSWETSCPWCGQIVFVTDRHLLTGSLPPSSAQVSAIYGTSNNFTVTFTSLNGAACRYWLPKE